MRRIERYAKCRNAAFRRFMEAIYYQPKLKRQFEQAQRVAMMRRVQPCQ